MPTLSLEKANHILGSVGISGDSIRAGRTLRYRGD